MVANKQRGRALAQARLGTLDEDLHLRGVEYNTITSILFIVSHQLSSVEVVHHLQISGLYRSSTTVQPPPHQTQALLVPVRHDGLVVSLPNKLIPSLADDMGHRGGISAVQAATQSFAGELVCRLFLGAVEAPFFSYALPPNCFSSSYL